MPLTEREYQRKPQRVKAVQFDGTVEQARELVSKYHNVTFGCGKEPPFRGKLLVVHPLRGHQTAYPGDYILPGKRENEAACIGQIDFEHDYELVAEAPSSASARVAEIMRERYPQETGEPDAAYLARLQRHAETGPDRGLDEALEAAWREVGAA